MNYRRTYSIISEKTGERRDFTNKRKAANVLRAWKAAGMDPRATIKSSGGVLIGSGSAAEVEILDN